MDCNWGFASGSAVKTLPAIQGTRETGLGRWVGVGVETLGREDTLEEDMAIHSTTLAWKIPWTGESGRLQSIKWESWTGLKWHYASLQAFFNARQ